MTSFSPSGISRRLKLVIVISSFPPETFIINKILELLIHNDVFVFCPNFDKKLYKELLNTYSNLRIKNTSKIYLYIRQIITKYILQIRDSRKEVLNNSLINYIQAINPDIIHFEFSAVASFYSKAFEKIKVKKIVSCRGTNENVRALINSEVQKNLQQVFTHADRIHCVSLAMQRNILKYQIEKNKIFINHPGVDTQLFVKKNKKQLTNDVLILSVGRLVFQKGIFNGILAFKKLCLHNNQIKWLIAGNGELKNEILFYILNMGLKDRIILLGAKTQQELLELYSNADIFFLPSVSEGIANVVLEAMSMELPVVSTKAGGMEEVITHGVNGLLAEVYDHEQLAEHILLLAQDVEMRKRLGAAARKHVSENFHIERQIKVFEEVYKELAAQKTIE